MQRMLRICEEIEQVVSQIYRHWQQVFVGEPSLSSLWAKLADDELDHVRQVQLARRVVTENVFERSHFSLETLETLLRRAKKLHSDVLELSIPAEKALKVAIKMEDEFSKAHLLNATDIADLSMRRMFETLARADDLHIRALKDYYEAVYGKK